MSEIVAQLYVRNSNNIESQFHLARKVIFEKTAYHNRTRLGVGKIYA